MLLGFRVKRGAVLGGCVGELRAALFCCRELVQEEEGRLMEERKKRKEDKKKREAAQKKVSALCLGAPGGQQPESKPFKSQVLSLKAICERGPAWDRSQGRFFLSQAGGRGQAGTSGKGFEFC